MPSAEISPFLQARERLEATHRSFLTLLLSIPDSDWEGAHPGHRWTVKDELTHLVQVVNAVCNAVDRAAVGRKYSYLWLVPAWIRNLINGYLVLPSLAQNATRESIARSYHAAHNRLLTSLEALPESAWSQGTHFPRTYRTIRELANRPVEHFQEHRDHLHQRLGSKISNHKPKLAIRKYQPSDWKTVRQLGVAADQVKYVGTVAALFEDEPGTWIFHVIEVGQTIVGFFNLDTAYPEQYSFAQPGEVGLRAFFIDAAFQGLGFGKAAVRELQPYLRKNYREHPSICLTVNCENPEAYHIYLAGGFQDTGEIYHGGAAGPQHILRMPIE